MGSEISGDNRAVMFTLWLLTQVGNQLVSTFFNIGTILLFLAIVRGKQAGIHLLFGGMPYLLRGFLTSLLFFLIVVVGLILLIVPGIYLALRLWPFLYFIVDRDADIVESLSLSWNPQARTQRIPSSKVRRIQRLKVRAARIPTRSTVSHSGSPVQELAAVLAPWSHRIPTVVRHRQTPTPRPPGCRTPRRPRDRSHLARSMSAKLFQILGNHFRRTPG